MSWDEWFDLDLLKTISRHISGSAGSLLGFTAMGALVEILVPEGALKTVLRTVESFVLVGLIMWLAYQLGRVLWRERI